MASLDRVKVSVCELPDNLSLRHPAWRDILRRIESDRPDIALLNEMPLGPWIASEATFSNDLATATIAAHESGLLALRKVPTAVICSRPVQGRYKLANEAFLLSGSAYQAIHHKQYFPQETGFFEERWFVPGQPGFDVAEYRGVRIGVLLGAELTFTEWARHYREQGAHLIVSPRASGPFRRHRHIAARMAAIASGCYVLSSNRVSGGTDSRPRFDGRGFVYSPTGELLGETSASEPFLCVNIELDLVTKAQRHYSSGAREAHALEVHRRRELANPLARSQ